jgi:hypothetical protein
MTLARTLGCDLSSYSPDPTCSEELQDRSICGEELVDTSQGPLCPHCDDDLIAELTCSCGELDCKDDREQCPSCDEHGCTRCEAVADTRLDAREAVIARQIDTDHCSIANQLGGVVSGVASVFEWITRFGDIERAHASHLYALTCLQEAIVVARDIGRRAPGVQS